MSRVTKLQLFLLFIIKMKRRKVNAASYGRHGNVRLGKGPSISHCYVFQMFYFDFLKQFGSRGMAGLKYQASDG